MKFTIDESRKLIFGWSGKCGCTHLKRIAKFLKDDIDLENPHHPLDYKIPLPKSTRKFTAVLVVRSPYERLVSGFIDKYSPKGEFNRLWDHKTPLTFANFVEELTQRNWKVVDRHHFIPQTEEYFDDKKLKQTKNLKIYDLAKIDYQHIESFYKKKIPEGLIRFRGNHRNIRTKYLEEPVHDRSIYDFIYSKVPFKFFYSPHIKEKVNLFYQKDFEFFRRHGFEYKIV